MKREILSVGAVVVLIVLAILFSKGVIALSEVSAQAKTLSHQNFGGGAYKQ